LGRGYVWLDTGSHDSLLHAGQFISTLENRQGLKICCPEEISYRLGWISAEKLLKIANLYMRTNYGKYLMKLVEES
jgi:glucose-1-phosphate thymidylyltransferase